MERNSGLRAVLTNGFVYSSAQRAIGSDRSARFLCDEVIRSGRSDTVVDIGSGTSDITKHLRFGAYVGIEPNESYVDRARAELASSFGDRARVVHAGIGDPTLVEQLPSEADVVIMVGVLHHLDDELASAALALASGLIGPSGRFVSIDPGFVPGQPKIARYLAARDRGQFVREPDALRALVSAHFESVQMTEHHDLLRVPYTHLLVEASSA